MKKTGVCVIAILLLFSFIALGLAQTDNDSINDSDTTDTDTTDDTTTSSTSTSTSAPAAETLGNESKAFECLEEKVGAGCANIESITELALTVLSTPNNAMSGCVTKLLTKRQPNGDFNNNIKETALAVIALKHAGEEVGTSVRWLLEQRQVPTDLVWYLQQDSDEAVTCKIEDGSLTYEIEIDENKKISQDAGNCLKLAQSSFWYRIDPSCYANLFKISCDQDFITNLIYKNVGFVTRALPYYVLEDTQTSPALGVTEHRLASSCLGAPGTCDYEGTAWGALALKVADEEINDYIPYLIATADLKESYLPDAFIYLLTDYENYATRLIQKQQFHHWKADSSSYNEYYDTALAILALGTIQSQTQDAKNWLYFEQGLNGCWANSVTETAFILWALYQRDYFVEGTTEYCEASGFFCIPSSFCSTSNDLSSSYACSGSTVGQKACCKENELRTCEEIEGTICASDKECSGSVTETLYSTDCCTSECVIPTVGDDESECEANYYSCYSECSEDTQEEVPYDCEGSLSCCKPKPRDSDDDSDGGIPWWIWLLIVLIILVAGAIIFVYRDKIKSKFQKNKDDEEGPSRPGMPPHRPGMPPGRPGMLPGRPGMPPRRGPIRRRPGPPGAIRPPRPGMPPRGRL